MTCSAAAVPTDFGVVAGDEGWRPALRGRRSLGLRRGEQRRKQEQAENGSEHDGFTSETARGRRERTVPIRLPGQRGGGQSIKALLKGDGRPRRQRTPPAGWLSPATPPVLETGATKGVARIRGHVAGPLLRGNRAALWKGPKRAALLFVPARPVFSAPRFAQESRPDTPALLWAGAGGLSRMARDVPGLLGWLDSGIWLTPTPAQLT